MRGAGAVRTGVAPGGALAPRWTQQQLWRAARAVPSLDLNFADSKSLVDWVTGQSLVTFTRASSGTFIDGAGVLQTAATNVPRFDHNPLTGESLGLLVEEQRTNLLLRSEEFDNALWPKTNATITANSIAAPTGAITADSLIETAATGQHRVSRGITGTTNTNPHVVSFFAKANTRTRVYVGLVEGTTFSRQGNAVFDLSAGTVVNATGGGNGATGGAATIQNFGNGWYRCTYTIILGGTDTTVFTDINLVSTGTTFNYTGDGTSGIYIWGAQLEAGAFPTSYIPTTTAAVTRSADVASITGANFSSWYNQTEGTLFVDSRRGDSVTTQHRPAAYAGNSGNTNRIEIRNFSIGANTRAYVNDGGSSQANFENLATIPASTSVRVAIATKLNDFAAAANGLSPQADTSGTAPVVDRLEIGTSLNQANYLNGHISRLTYWPLRLILQALTQ